MAKEVFGFDVNGLEGYRVAKDDDGYWYVRLAPGKVRTFAWNDDTLRHDVPVKVDGPSAWGIERAKSAKGAVAAAYRHARMVSDTLAKC